MGQFVQRLFVSAVCLRLGLSLQLCNVEQIFEDLVCLCSTATQNSLFKIWFVSAALKLCSVEQFVQDLVYLCSPAPQNSLFKTWFISATLQSRIVSETFHFVIVRLEHGLSLQLCTMESLSRAWFVSSFFTVEQFVQSLV